MKGFAMLGLVRNMLRGERRRAIRYSVLLSGQILGSAGSSKVTIHDLSVTGALVRGDFLPAAGGAVMLARDGLEIAANVMWKNGNRAGLRFGRRIPVDQLFSIVHESNHVRRASAPAQVAT